MTNNQNKFMFYENFYLAIEKLPEQKRAEACYEFCKYGITGELPKDENLAMFCIGVSASVQKYQGRGGNHNPTGNNQYKKCGQNGQNGQNGQKKQTETKTKTETKTEEYKESFDKFWEMYPKQRAGSKEKAYASFCKAIKEKRATEENILTSVKVYANSDEVKRGFAKGCAAWLNDDRFNNEYQKKEENWDAGYGRC